MRTQWLEGGYVDGGIVEFGLVVLLLSSSLPTKFLLVPSGDCYKNSSNCTLR